MSAEKVSHKIIFDRAFDSKKKDMGSRDDIMVGDHITFILDDVFMTREVASVNGLIITTKPFANEKRFIIERKIISQILRPNKGKK